MSFLKILACPWSLSTSSLLEQKVKMNLVRFLSVLFIFSKLILGRINSEIFTVTKLALFRPAVKFLASVLLWVNLYNSIFFKYCLNTWIVLNIWLQVLSWDLQDSLFCLPYFWYNFSDFYLLNVCWVVYLLANHVLLVIVNHFNLLGEVSIVLLCCWSWCLG